MTASGGALNYALLTDGDPETATKLPIPETVGQSAWIQYEFEKPERVRAINYAELAASAHALGLKQYGEAIENKRQAFGDDISRSS